MDSKMPLRYSHILSPIQVGGLTFKSRLTSGNALPHFLMGPETYPAEPVISHMGNVARNGAAMVTFADYTNMEQRNSPNEDGKRFPMFTLDTDPSVENYMCQLTDRIHYYNSYASMALMPFTAPDPFTDINDEPAVDLANSMMAKFGERVYDSYGMAAMRRGGAPARQLTREEIHAIIEEQAQRARKYQLLGFDVCTLHFAYRATLFSRFLSPKTNHRTDEYGGSLENRARFLLELCARIKQLCGKDYPIEVQLTAQEEGGTTLADTIELAHMAEGLVDIFQFRAETANLNHPTGYNSSRTHYAVLDDCAAVKASGTKILCAPIGGFQTPDDMEAVLAAGKADLIAGARMFIADFDFYQKIKEGRGEDVVPCIRCNKCHVPSLTGNWLSGCSVNPRMGLEHRIESLTVPAGRRRNVAVVGGGPAGMRAALLAAERGYAVTLYEATDRLGGQLKLMDAPTFKWPLVRYRDWLISQLKNADVRVLLQTPATRERLEAGGYDAVILALGAVPKRPPVPGAERARTIFEVFGAEKEMGQRCVVIGGSESGTEAALYLAENGHTVTILTRGDTLAPDATPIHYRETMDEYYQTMEHISYHTGATTVEISDGWVDWKDTDGTLHRIECDDVVALGGMQPLNQEAMGLYGLTADTFMIGDCREVGNLHTCNRGAFAVVSNL